MPGDRITAQARRCATTSARCRCGEGADRDACSLTGTGRRSERSTRSIPAYCPEGQAHTGVLSGQKSDGRQLAGSCYLTRHGALN